MLTSQQIQQSIEKAAQQVFNEGNTIVDPAVKDYLTKQLLEKNLQEPLSEEQLYKAAISVFEEIRTEQLLQFYHSKGRQYLVTPGEDLQEAAGLRFFIDLDSIFKIKLPWPWGTSS
jgi:hypothetical protein